MADAFRTITIHDAQPETAASAAPACAGRLHDPARAQVCRTLVDQPGQAPQLSGLAAGLARLMAALVAPLGCALDGAGLVRSLQLQMQPGEAELRLALPPHWGGAVLADTAFQTVRGLLPNTDTDIYLLPG